jgi:hypothetical protein
MLGPLNAAKKIILFTCLLLMAGLANVSAATPGAAKTCAWEKSFASLETRQAEPLQTAGGHWKNGSVGYDVALDCLLAAEGGTSFFEGTSYSTEVMEKMATDPFHDFPESVTAFEDAGQTTTFTGGDGAAYTRLDIPGSYPSQAGTWYNGTFQFIKNSDNVITHRAFIPSP